MDRSQLEHAIRAACTILGCDEVIIVGSQSILGTWDERELPSRATLTAEADILSTDPDRDRVMIAADQIDGAAGEFSQFHQTHGFYLDGVDLSTCVLPESWRGRLVAVRNANTKYCTGWCLDPGDLCIAKLVAAREKDIEFVDALLAAGLVNSGALLARLDEVRGHVNECARAREWLARNA